MDAGGRLLSADSTDPEVGAALPPSQLDYSEWCDLRQENAVHNELNPIDYYAVTVHDVESLGETVRHSREHDAWREDLPLFRATILEVNGRADFSCLERDDLLTGLLEADEEVWARANEQPDPPTWHDLEPSRRYLDPGTTPSEVMDDLRSVSLLVLVPEEWMGSDDVLCTRSSLGWNPCYALFEGRGQATVLVAYVEPGEPLELLLMPEDLDYDSEPLYVRPLPWSEVERLDMFDARNLGEVSVVLRLTAEPDGTIRADVEEH